MNSDRSIRVDISPETERGYCPQELGFGSVFSDHMFIQKYDENIGWHDAQIKPFHDLTLHPAASVLHYGQEIFEGLKAYRRSDGVINLFRPDQNIARFNSSADLMAMPQVDEKLHLEAIQQLVLSDKQWVPSQSGASLYIRPAMIATTSQLSVTAAS